MTEHQATRTLVKSPPELWAECSDAASLARHLGQFGEIRITRLDPETAVAWEGERARGTVRIEPAGWGTKVTLTALAVAVDCPPVEAPADAPVEVATPDESYSPAPRPRRFARLLAWLRASEPPSRPLASEPRPASLEAPPEPDPVSEPDPPPAAEAQAALAAALDSLGQAHHRPFSRG
jgi:hypothetical protein